MTRSIRLDDWVWDPNTLELRKGSYVATLEPRVARLFEFMVAHPGELLSRDRLVDEVWEGRVVSDEALRRAVFNLRQTLAAGGSDSYIRTVHKKGYVATFPLTVAADQAAVSNPTPLDPGTTAHDAPVTMAPVMQDEPAVKRVDPFRRWPLSLGIIAAVALIAVLLTQLNAVREREPISRHAEIPAATPATIAVLPFINLSEAADNQLLADGLTEELFGTLERNPELRVTARSSAFQFEAEDRDARKLGGRLGVRYVLVGNLRRNAENVLVKAKLVDSETGTQLWAETYDRAFSDWLLLQQDIALDVAHAVERILQREFKAFTPGRTVNAEAQLELLRARQLLFTRSVADAEQAIEHLQRALTLDPNYALAYARLADAILIQAESTTGITSVRSVVAPLLDKALAFDPELGEAYALRSQLADDPAAAERDLRRGLELNPSYARGYELLAYEQSRDPLQLPQAIATIDNAIALDPLTPGNYHAKAMLKMGLGKWQEAAELDRRALALNPNYRAALTQLSMTYAIQGYFADAVGYARQAVALDPRAVPLREYLILMYLAVGDLESARAADNPPTELGTLAIPWAEGKVTELADTLYGAESVSNQDAVTVMASRVVASHILLRQAASDGDYGRAVALLSPLLLVDGGLRPDVSGWGLYAYTNLAQLLRLSGDIAAASRLQQQMEDRMSVMESRFPPHRFIHEQLRAILLARSGRGDDACAALEYSYTPNPRLYWKMILDNPAFDRMADTPCLQAMRARINQHIATERERIDTMKREEEAAKPVPENADFSADAAT